MNKNIYYINSKNFNEKCHDLYNIYFKKNYNELKFNDIDNIINFIKENNKSNNFII